MEENLLYASNLMNNKREKIMEQMYELLENLINGKSD